jgi:hypothetical protein
MAEPSNLRHLHNRAHIWRMDASWNRSVFVERQMRAAVVVIIEVGFQDTSQTGIIKYDHVVQALSPNRSD